MDVGGDYVFQIIARENKGPPHGIDYKYSKMVTREGGEKGEQSRDSGNTSQNVEAKWRETVSQKDSG